MTQPSCLTCRFCAQIQLPDKVLQFVCRRNPPQLFAQAFPLQQHGVGGQPQFLWSMQRLQPAVGEGDWCGEYDEKQARLADA